MIVCLNNIDDLYNVRMGDHLKDFYLPTNCLLSLRVADLHLLVCLYCYLLVLGLEDGHTNRCVCALTDHLAHHVILLELHGQVRRVGEHLAIFFEAAGKGEAGEHLIVLILEL